MIQDRTEEIFWQEMRRTERRRSILAGVAVVFLLMFMAGIGAAGVGAHVQFIQWAAGR